MECRSTLLTVGVQGQVAVAADWARRNCDGALTSTRDAGLRDGGCWPTLMDQSPACQSRNFIGNCKGPSVGVAKISNSSSNSTAYGNANHEPIPGKSHRSGN